MKLKTFLIAASDPKRSLYFPAEETCVHILKDIQYSFAAECPIHKTLMSLLVKVL